MRRVRSCRSLRSRAGRALMHYRWCCATALSLELRWRAFSCCCVVAVVALLRGCWCFVVARLCHLCSCAVAPFLSTRCGIRVAVALLRLSPLALSCSLVLLRCRASSRLRAARFSLLRNYAMFGCCVGTPARVMHGCANWILHLARVRVARAPLRLCSACAVIVVLSCCDVYSLRARLEELCWVRV